jgi:hypothetical protein
MGAITALGTPVLNDAGVVAFFGDLQRPKPGNREGNTKMEEMILLGSRFQIL